MPRIQYRIPMLTVKSILAYAVEAVDRYAFVLNENQTKDCLRLGYEHLQDDNGIFFQAMCQLHGNRYAQPKEDCILEDLWGVLLYLDFKDIFDRSTKQQRYALRQQKAESMFRPEGITLDFGGGPHRYLAFERSASMGRNAKLSFIREDLYEPMRQRMMLDMKIGICQLSKLYAYNGLLFSSGTRMDGIGIDAPHRVVVVDNESYTLPNAKTITVEDDGSGNAMRAYCRVESRMDIPITCMDGEGLISKTYAATVDKAYCGKHIHTSFQIRLPYIKGMVHQVDFKGFLRDCGTTHIRDIWGALHPVEDVDIVLTRSMFKGAGWLKDNNMTWDDYWTAFRKYNHGLYITNVSKENAVGFTELNYQFLNTVSITAEEFRPSDLPMGWDHSPDENPRHWITKATETAYYNFCANEDFRHQYFLDYLSRRGISKTDKNYLLARILNKNPLFLTESVYTEQLDAQADSLLQKYAIGQLQIAGDNRFLSGDLMDLMISLLDKNPNTNRRKNKLLMSALTNSITPASFLAPGAVYPEAESYTLLRNPHIARNEEIQLKPHTARDNARSYYLGHLTDVVMVDPRSAIAERLGGADYDGDMVKTIADPLLNKCVRRNYEYDTYCSVDEQNNLPLLKIPSAAPQLRDANDWQARFETVKNTFSSRVGQISNAALNRSIIAYNENLSEEQRRQYREETETLAILTGLEIDSAKSGVKPDLSAFLGSKAVQRSRFLKFKNLMESKEERRAWYEPTFEEQYNAFFSKTDWASVTSNLEKLPYFAHLLKVHTPRIKAKTVPAEQLFSFAMNPNRQAGLDESVLAAIADLIDTYDRCLKRIRANRHPLKQQKKKSDIDRILKMRGQEDTYDTDVLYGLFVNLPTERIQEIRNALTEQQWHLMKDDQRQQFLLDFLPEDEFADYHDLFSDFRFGGYRILGDLICDHDDARQGQDNNKLHFENDPSHMTAMVDAYLSKRPGVSYREAVAKECRKLLERIVKPSLAARYVVALDKRRFLWDVLLDKVESEVRKA